MSSVFMRRLAPLVAIVLAQAACRDGPPPAHHTRLPYYEEATFTPRWAPVAHRVGPFTLKAHTGRTFTDAELVGRVHVVGFLYTACPNICPRLVASLKQVGQRTQGTGLGVVVYSVTPDTDTPAVLGAFARRHGVATAWTLATGSRQEVARLARERYFALDPRSPDGTGADPLLHSEMLVLVDGAGRIRGVYNGLQPSDLDHLVRDAEVLTGPRRG